MSGDTLRVRTTFSTYEIEHTGHGIRVRRLDGVNEPTPNQGADGQWQAVSTYDWEAGGILFQWLDLPGKATLTSRVRGVEVSAGH